MVDKGARVRQVQSVPTTFVPNWTLPEGYIQGLSLYLPILFHFSVFAIIFLRSFIGVFVFAVPNAPPANVTGKNVTSTSIFVQWDEVPANNQNGAIVNYTVTYTELPNGSPTAEMSDCSKKECYIDRFEKIYQLQDHGVCVYCQRRWQ